MTFFTEWGFPPILVVVLILVESIGMLLLVIGLGGRVWAGAASIVMIVLGLTLIVLIAGSGKWSVDRLLLNRPRSSPTTDSR